MKVSKTIEKANWFQWIGDVMIKMELEASKMARLQMLVERRASQLMTSSLGPDPSQLERILTVKRHDCDCVRLLEKVDGRFFKYLD